MLCKVAQLLRKQFVQCAPGREGTAAKWANRESLGNLQGSSNIHAVTNRSKYSYFHVWTGCDLKAILFKDGYSEAKYGEPKFTWSAQFYAELFYTRHLGNASDLFKCWHLVTHSTHLWCIHFFHCIVVTPGNSNWDQGPSVLSTVAMPKQKIPAS